MKEIATENIEEGMVLSTDVIDPSGNTLLGAGTVLTEKHCQLLSRREVTSVRIKDEEEESASPAEAAAGGADEATEMAPSEEDLAEIQHMFEPVMSDPLMAELFNKAMKYAGRKTAND